MDLSLSDLKLFEGLHLDTMGTSACPSDLGAEAIGVASAGANGNFGNGGAANLAMGGGKSVAMNGSAGSSAADRSSSRNSSVGMNGDDLMDGALEDDAGSLSDDPDHECKICKLVDSDEQVAYRQLTNKCFVCVCTGRQ